MWQGCLREAHQQAFQPAQRCLGGLVAEAQPLLHILVKVFEQGLAGVEHGVADLSSQVILQLLEGRLNLLGMAAGLVNLGNATLKIDTGLDRT